MTLKQRITNSNGFTLVEMLIVMVLFIVVMMLTTDIFERMLPKTKLISKSAENSFQGIVGLEMFRRDLEQAGFGLFTAIEGTPPQYEEVVSAAPQSDYNDATKGIIPRAIVGANNLASAVLPGTDLLVIKATSAALNAAAQSWTSIKGPGTSKIWGANDLKPGHRVTVVSQSYKNGELQRKLIYDTPTVLTVAYKADGSYAAPFAPSSSDQQYYYYGIDTVAPRAPFNRTDYYVKRVAGDVPAGCSPAAGVLYKSVMNQSAGSMEAMAVLDCVADMQVIFGWNSGGDPSGNAVDTYTNAEGGFPSSAYGPANVQSFDDPRDIRTRLKLIKVYILVQDGGFDKNYTNTDTALRIGEAGETGEVKEIDLTAPNYRNYRWKLHRLVVRPRNLS